MEVYAVRRTSAPARPMRVAGASGGASSDSFGQQFGRQMKEDCRRRAADLFREIAAEAADLAGSVDLARFERHRRLIGELLNEIVCHAYDLRAECITDASGRQRLYTAIRIIDRKLDAMARELLDLNRDWIDYMGRMDEIRGLVLDLLS